MHPLYALLLIFVLGLIMTGYGYFRIGKISRTNTPLLVMLFGLVIALASFAGLHEMSYGLKMATAVAEPLCKWKAPQIGQLSNDELEAFAEVYVTDNASCQSAILQSWAPPVK